MGCAVHEKLRSEKDAAWSAHRSMNQSDQVKAELVLKRAVAAGARLTEHTSTCPECKRGLSPSEQATIRARLTGHCFDDQQLGELAGRVRDTLQSFGYFRATVSEPSMTIVDVSRHPNPVSLNFEVVEGARYKVREVNWSGINKIPFEQIVSVSQIHPEDIFDTSKVRETVEALRRLYAAIGYPTASIVPQFRVHEAGHWVSVSFSVVEGAQSP